MSRIHGLRSRRISLVERSCLNFCSCYFIYLCVGEDLPHSSNDVDEGWQWEIQIDEGWIPYWDSQV
jgi:hypothetical protein